jgi:hypothetical protein
MNEKERIAARLAPLDDIGLSSADIEHVMEEVKDIERVVAELEEFARDVPWMSQQTQPSPPKAGS